METPYKFCNTISVIIPTMWRSHFTENLVQTLLDADQVKEVIIIDNASQSRPRTFKIGRKKLIYVGLSENIYVNPAWNLGANIAKGEYICFCNDDIDFNPQSLFTDSFLAQIKSKTYGIARESYELDTEPPEPILHNRVRITQNWGSLLILKRSRYVPIPEDLKVWHGDSWIMQRCGSARSFITRIKEQRSTTASSPEFEQIKSSDIQNWVKYKKRKFPRIRFRRIRKTIRAALPVRAE